MLALLLACHAPIVEAPVATDDVYRHRPGDALPAIGPEARVDRGLRAAAEALASAATTPDARLNPGAVRGALELGGYPGPARFVRVIGTKELPDSLIASIPGDVAVDVGWAWRDFADGRRWWVLGWSPRRLKLDPVPTVIAPGRGVGVRVEGAKAPRLFVVSPSGSWKTYTIARGDTRWIGGLREVGDWRFEVVDGDRVELLFGVHVGEPVPPLPPLASAKPLENPITAVDGLYRRVNELRKVNGLAPLKRFVDFEMLVREQASCLASEGVAAHSSVLCPGVPGRATQGWYPRGHFYEDVAVADTAAEAWETLLASPGHLANILCADCTHLSVGAAIEPATDPRLFVVWEAMAFPQGEPEPIR